MDMQKSSKADYHKALRNYFFITKGYVYSRILHKIEVDVNTINEYEATHRLPTKHEVIIRAIVDFLGQTVGAIVYCVIVVYVLKEVFDIDLSYSIKNILLLTLVVLGYKVKFRLGAKE